jgi:hypothetical protein
MKTINLTNEQHQKLKNYSFSNQITIKDSINLAIDMLTQEPLDVKVLNSTSTKVLNNTNVKVLNSTSTNVFEDLDWTDKKAQDLIDPSILEKYNIS